MQETIQSFKRSNNNDIADLLIELQDTLASVSLTPDILRNPENNLSLEGYPEIGEKFDEIDSRLREFIEEKEFWSNVTEYVQQKLGN